MSESFMVYLEKSTASIILHCLWLYLGLPETESTYDPKIHVKGLTEMAVGEMQHVVGMCLGPPLHYCYAVTVANMHAKARI